MKSTNGLLVIPAQVNIEVAKPLCVLNEQLCILLLRNSTFHL